MLGEVGHLVGRVAEPAVLEVHQPAAGPVPQHVGRVAVREPQDRVEHPVEAVRRIGEPAASRRHRVGHEGGVLARVEGDLLGRPVADPAPHRAGPQGPLAEARGLHGGDRHGVQGAQRGSQPGRTGGVSGAPPRGVPPRRDITTTGEPSAAVSRRRGGGRDRGRARPASVSPAHSRSGSPRSQERYRFETVDWSRTRSWVCWPGTASRLGSRARRVLASWPDDSRRPAHRRLRPHPSDRPRRGRGPRRRRAGRAAGPGRQLRRLVGVAPRPGPGRPRGRRRRARAGLDALGVRRPVRPARSTPATSATATRPTRSPPSGSERTCSPTTSTR